MDDNQRVRYVRVVLRDAPMSELLDLLIEAVLEAVRTDVDDGSVELLREMIAERAGEPPRIAQEPFKANAWTQLAQNDQGKR